MTNQIGKCYLHLLPNSAHFAFMQMVLQRARKDPKIGATASLASHLARFDAAFAQEDQDFCLSQKSMLTDRLNALDSARCRAYMAYKSIVKGYAKLPVPEIQTQTKRLLQHIRDYRISVRTQRDIKSGELSNFIQDLEDRFAAEVEALHLGLVVQTLKESNDSYLTTREQRTEERMTRRLKAFATSRIQTDTAYRSFAAMVNALAIVEGVDGYADFIGYVNTLIAQFKQEVFGRRLSPATDDASGEEASLPDDGEPSEERLAAQQP